MDLSVASSGRRSLASALLNKTTHNAKTTPRIQRPIPDDFRKIIIEYINKSDVKAYEDLVCYLRYYPIEDAELSKLLKNARENISLLTRCVQHFVHAIVKIKWTHRCGTTVKDYQGFLVDLLSAHNYYTKLVFEELVSTFKAGNEDLETSIPTVSSRVVNNYVHEVLQVLLHIIPMSSNLLKETVEAHFPYLKRSCEEHVCYIVNTLRITEYQPGLRTDFLFLIIDKLIIMDVNAPKHEIISTQNTENEELFHMDQDDPVPGMKHPIANTLDHSLSVLLGYLNMICHDITVFPPELKLEDTKLLFQEVLNVFDCLILPTHATHHVQFVMFYMCNVKVALAATFLSYLWRKITSPRVANVIRQTAVAYIGSFLVRSKNITVGLLTKRLAEMTYWIHSYICKQEDIDCTHGDLRIHPVFYSVCQAIFYIISLKYNEFVGTKKGLLFLQGLNLTKIVTCNLNPLKFCLPEIVHNFAAVTRNYQLAYCYTIIEHNSRMNLPIVYVNDQGLTQGAIAKEILDTFFPFDPFILKKSSQYISSCYQEVKFPILNESFCSEDQKQDEDDDFLFGYSPSTPSMPILGLSPTF